MKITMNKSFLITLILLNAISNAWEQDQTYDITILHTNDHHGHFWTNDDGEYGLAAQKTLIDRLRADVEKQGGTVLLLSGGDINTGVPESDLLNAEPDFKGMNLIGYDAMALGNHEFDKPIDILKDQQSWVDFPFLSANIYQKNTNERLFQPYEIFDQQGVKIAVIGLTTDDTIKVSNPENIQDIEFRKPAIEIKQIIEELKETEKPDVIIAVTHMGHYDDGNYGSNAEGDVEMARSLPLGYLDMIVGGHSQNPLCMSDEANIKQKDYVPGTACVPDQQNGTWIVQAHEWGKYVGRADFEFKNGEFSLKNYELIPVNLVKKEKKEDGSIERTYYTEEIAHDPVMLELLTPFQEKGQEKLSVKIGSVDDKLEGDRSVVRFEQTNLAQLILAGVVERLDADLAVMGGGSIRDSILAGNITYKDLLKVQPFKLDVVYVDMTGQELLDYLQVVANLEAGSGAYPQFYNLDLTINQDSSISDVKIKGEAIDPNKNYRLVTYSFNAVGGDGYPNIVNHPKYVNTGFLDVDVLKNYVEQQSPIKTENYVPKHQIINHKK